MATLCLLAPLLLTNQLLVSTTPSTSSTAEAQAKWGDKGNGDQDGKESELIRSHVCYDSKFKPSADLAHETEVLTKRYLADISSTIHTPVSEDDNIAKVTVNIFFAYQSGNINDHAVGLKVAHYHGCRNGICTVSVPRIELALLVLTLFASFIGRAREGAAIALLIAWIVEYWIYMLVFFILCWISIIINFLPKYIAIGSLC